jgi:hypothetical protein
MKRGKTQMKRARPFLLLTLFAALWMCSTSSPVAKDAGMPSTVSVSVPGDDPFALPAPTGPTAATQPDRRAPAQIERAACQGADGSWHCKNVVRPLAADGPGPIIPSSWTVPAWFVDPQNLSMTASDQNSCTTAISPCLTYQQIYVQRWGCRGGPSACPRFRQTTTITFLSNHTDNTDPVYLYPASENAATVSVQGVFGAAQQIATGTIAALGFVAKDRTPPGTLLQANTGATATEQVIVNATHPSVAITYKSLGAGVFAISQPLVAVTIPVAASPPAEVDTWAPGDSVTVFDPVKVNLVGVGGMLVDLNGGFSNILTFYRLNVVSPGAAFGALQVNAGMTYFVESIINRIVTQAPQAPILFSAWTNTGIPAIFHGSGGSTQQTFVSGGYLRGGSASCSSCAWRQDVILGTFVNTSEFNSLAVGAYIEAGKNFNIFGSMSVTSAGSVWGPGTLNIPFRGTFIYPAGAAGATFKQGAFRMNGSNLAHSMFTAANVDTPCGDIPITAANLDLASSATCATTGFGGTAYNPGGASITKMQF